MTKLHLTDREMKLIDACEDYAKEPCGLPGHALMLLVAKLAAAVVSCGAVTLIPED